MTSAGRCPAIVPVRDFRAGKTRLAPALSAEERELLGRWMLEQVLRALNEADSIGPIAVLSDSEEVLALAETLGAVGLRCPGDDLNADLERGRSWALDGGADSLLAVPGDLPALRREEVEAMRGIAATPAGRGRSLAILAPSPDGGTNGLLLSPADALPFSFGPGSFERHRKMAEAAGLEVFPFERAGFRLDVDRPADLASLLESGVAAPEWLTSFPLP